jgi:hypothetical protein
MNLPLYILTILALVLLALTLGAYWRMKKYEQLLRRTKLRVWSPPPPPPVKPTRGEAASRRRRAVYHLSRRKYARPRAQVEKEIARLYGFPGPRKKRSRGRTP